MVANYVQQLTNLCTVVDRCRRKVFAKSEVMLGQVREITCDKYKVKDIP